MPQMTKGGKFIFGKSLIKDDLELNFPKQAINEYDICKDKRVYLFTGSKSTGGFCVTRKGLLLPSKLGHILTENPSLKDYTLREGMFIPYKGREYCWLSISPTGSITLTEKMMNYLNLKRGMSLLSIRSSNIAFTMGATGPLIEKSINYSGEIKQY